MKELEATLTLRNNRLKERRLAKGMTQREIAIAIGISLFSYNQYETMKYQPFSVRNGWKPSAQKIADFFDAPLDELFPGAVLAVENPKAVRLLDGWEADALVSGDSGVRCLPPDRLVELHDDAAIKADAIEVVFRGLDERRRGIWKMHLDGISAIDIGKRFGIGRQRTSDIIGGIERRIRRRHELKLKSRDTAYQHETGEYRDDS